MYIPKQEEWLRASPDPKYAHLREDLHVEVTAFAPPAEAHARVAYALAEVRKYIIPDSNDEIRQKQARKNIVKILQYGRAHTVFCGYSDSVVTVIIGTVAVFAIPNE